MYFNPDAVKYKDCFDGVKEILTKSTLFLTDNENIGLHTTKISWFSKIKQ